MIRMPLIGLGGGRGIAQTTSTKNSGSGNETIPTGAIQVIITAIGGGGGGGCASPAAGGGSGSYSLLVRPVLQSEWGSTLAYAVGAGGTGETAPVANDSTNGAASTITGTLNGGAISISAGGGIATNNATGGAGGTATGGDTNTSGNAGTNAGGGLPGNGGSAPNGGAGGVGVDDAAGGNGTAPGGGGAGGDAGAVGGNGAVGRIVFVWS